MVTKAQLYAGGGITGRRYSKQLSTHRNTQLQKQKYAQKVQQELARREEEKLNNATKFKEVEGYYSVGDKRYSKDNYTYEQAGDYFIIKSKADSVRYKSDYDKSKPKGQRYNYSEKKYTPHRIYVDKEGNVTKEIFTAVAVTGDARKGKKAIEYNSKVINYSPTGSYQVETYGVGPKGYVRKDQELSYNKQGQVIGKESGPLREVTRKARTEEIDKLQAKRAVREGKIDDVEDYDLLQQGYTRQQINRSKSLSLEAQQKEFGKVLSKTKSVPISKKGISLQQGAYTVLGKDLQRKLAREPIIITKKVEKRTPIISGSTAIGLFTEQLTEDTEHKEKKSILDKTNQFVAERTTYNLLEPYNKKAEDFAEYEKNPTGIIGQIRKFEKENPIIIPFPKILGGDIDLFSSKRYTKDTQPEEFSTGIKGGAREGFYNMLREKPVTVGLLFGTGVGVGAVGTAVSGLKYGSIAFNILGGVGATYYTGSKIYQYATAETDKEKGKIIGESVIEMGALYAGSGVGTRGGKIVKAKISTLRQPGYIKSTGKINTVKETRNVLGNKLTRSQTYQPTKVQVGKKTYSINFKQQDYSITSGRTTISVGKSQYQVNGKTVKDITQSVNIIKASGDKSVGIGMSYTKPNKMTFTGFRGGTKDTFMIIPQKGVSIQYPKKTFFTISGTKGLSSNKNLKLSFQQLTSIKKVGNKELFVGNNQMVSLGRYEANYGKFNRVIKLGKKGQVGLLRQIPQPKPNIDNSFTPLNYKNIVSVARKEYFLNLLNKIPTGSSLGSTGIASSVINQRNNINNIDRISNEGIKVDIKQNIGEINIIDSVQSVSQKQKPESDFTNKRSQDIDNVLKQDQTQEVSLEQTQKQQTETVNDIKIIEEPVIITPFYPILKPSLNKSKKTEISTKTKQAYDVLVKRKQLKKGKGSYQSRGYKKANKKPLTKDAAIGLGMDITDTYVNRSFKIKPTTGSPKRRIDLEQKKRQLMERFRKAKKDNQIFVEKSKYAISSKEEKLGIPYESIQQRKKKAQQLLFKIAVANKKKRLKKSKSNINLLSKQSKKKSRTIKFL